MRATVVDTLPGGLVDLLRRVSPPLPGLTALAAGRAYRAAAELAALSTPAAAAWQYLARHSALLTLPDGGGLTYVDLVDPRPPWPPRPAPPSPDHPDAPLVRLLHLVAHLRDLRSMLPPLTSPEVTSARDVADGTLRQIHEVEVDLAPRWPELRPHLRLLAADIAARGGDPRAEELLRAAEEEFGADGDARAACAVVAGDWLAAPFASPVSWGFSLARPTSDDSAIPASIEDPEQSPPTDAARARSAYDTAEALYTGIGNRRGAAVVAWRRAYLLHATGRPDLAGRAAGDAAILLEAAGDAGAALVARAQAVLAGLAEGRLPVAAEVAAPIVRWGRDDSLAHAIGVGALFTRAGRRWARVERRPERAMSAFEIAEAVWAGLDRSVSRSQALADQATVLSGIGARQAAMVQLSRAIDADARPLREPADPMDVRRHRAALLAAELYNLANATADADGMERAQRELARVVAPFRRADPVWTPDQIAMADQLVGLAGTLGQAVMGHVFSAQKARDAGDDAEAARRFADAEAAIVTAPPDDADLLRAIVLGFRLRNAEAAAACRLWLAARLRTIEAARAQNPGAVVAELLDQLDRETRGQAFLFGVRFDDPALAREHLEMLRGRGEPWWAGLGTAWEYEEPLGRLHEAEHDLVGAAAAFDRAVRAVEEVRAELRRDDLRQAFGAETTVQQVYRNAARVRLRLREAALARGDAATATAEANEALRLMEQARNRALADLMAASGHDRPGAGPLDALVQAWRGAGAEAALAEDRLAAALRVEPPEPERVRERRRDLDAARAGLAAREADLRAHDERFWLLTAGAAVRPDPAAVMSQIPDGHAVLVYSLDRPDFLACGVTARGVVAAHWSRGERRIGALADRLVDACGHGGPWQDHARRLADILLAPLAAALDGAHTVHVVASGPTLRVPFTVLPWPDRPLGLHVDVSMLPSLSAYALLGAVRTAGPALVVGDPAAMSYRRTPDDPPQPQPPLPTAAVEAVAVARVLGVTPLLGARATEARVRAALPGARIAHLATHGVLDPDSPRAGAVLLADGEQITVAELMGMRISADLVVLSACETGTGSPAGGDEMLGLGRGLLAAGARSAVVTLWPVRDVSAALFMTCFHDELATGAAASTALRRAARWLAELPRDVARARLRELRDDDLVVGLPEAAREAVRGPLTDAARAIADTPAYATPYAHPAHWAPYLLLGR